jgi:hypothetical protein
MEGPTHELSGTDVDDLGFAGRFRDGQAVFSEAVEVEFDRLPDKGKDFFSRVARGDASGKVGDVRAPPVVSVF